MIECNRKKGREQKEQGKQREQMNRQQREREMKVKKGGNDNDWRMGREKEQKIK